METYGCRFWLMIFLLMLTFTGVITLGDIFGFIFGVVGFLLLCVLILSIYVHYKVGKERREAEARGEEYTGTTWHFGSSRRTSNNHNPNEGRVKVSRTGTPKKKKVSKDVGEYVDFEEE